MICLRLQSGLAAAMAAVAFPDDLYELGETLIEQFTIENCVAFSMQANYLPPILYFYRPLL